jgi:hypothetical protein
MTKNLLALVIVSVLTLAAVSCDAAGEGVDEIKRAATSLSGGDAQEAMMAELKNRTFTDKAGGVHECSEYLASVILSSWESETESWLMTYTGGYERGTYVFRFYEADGSFEHVAGPPLPPECGV